MLEDAPRYVRSYDRATGILTLSDGSQEELRPDTLRVRQDNSLSCFLKNDWPATFLPSAYYEIAKDVRESGPGQYVLHFLGRDYELSVTH